MQFAAGQHRLEKVSGIHAALGLARADDGMKLIDEEDDAALGFADLFQDRLQTLLKLAAVLSPGDQGAHVQGEDALVLQSLRDIALDNPLGEAFGDGGLADAGFTDQNRVVLGLSGEDADDVPDLVVTADDGVKLVLPCPLDQIRAVLGERVIGALGVVAGDRRGLHLGKLCGKGVFRDAVIGEDPLDGCGGGGEDADHQMLHRDVGVSHGLGGLLGRGQDPVGLRRKIRVGGAAHFRQGGNGGVKLCQHGVAVDAHLSQQGGNQTAVLVDQGIEQVLRRDVVVSVFEGHGLGSLDGLKAFLGQVLCIHMSNLL